MSEKGHFQTRSEAPSLPSIGLLLLHELTFCTLQSDEHGRCGAQAFVLDNGLGRQWIIEDRLVRSKLPPHRCDHVAHFIALPTARAASDQRSQARALAD
jgi:hypothetical protein